MDKGEWTKKIIDHKKQLLYKPGTRTGFNNLNSDVLFIIIGMLELESDIRAMIVSKKMLEYISKTGYRSNYLITRREVAYWQRKMLMIDIPSKRYLPINNYVYTAKQITIGNVDKNLDDIIKEKIEQVYKSYGNMPECLCMIMEISELGMEDYRLRIGLKEMIMSREQLTNIKNRMINNIVHREKRYRICIEKKELYDIVPEEHFIVMAYSNDESCPNLIRDDMILHTMDIVEYFEFLINELNKEIDNFFIQ